VISSDKTYENKENIDRQTLTDRQTDRETEMERRWCTFLEVLMLLYHLSGGVNIMSLNCGRTGFFHLIHLPAELHTTRTYQSIDQTIHKSVTSILFS